MTFCLLGLHEEAWYNIDQNNNTFYRQNTFIMSSAKYRPFDSTFMCQLTLTCRQIWENPAFSLAVLLVSTVFLREFVILVAAIVHERHQMETFSALLAICAGNSPVTGELPAKRPVTRSFDVFLDLRPNKRLSKESRGWWFETPVCSLWRHCNGLLIGCHQTKLLPPIRRSGTNMFHFQVSDLISKPCMTGLMGWC